MTRDPDNFLAAADQPSLPGVAQAVLELSRTAVPNLGRLVEAIESDTSLAAMITQAANSSSAGPNQAVQSIEQAVLLLGTLTVTNLVLSSTLAAEDLPAGAGAESHSPPEVLSLLTELRNRAFCDHLTGIYNRYFFEETLTREHRRSIRYSEPIGLIFLDLDYFKQINDTYGHLFGDEVLRQVAQSIQKSVRVCDVVARFGGEEFVVLVLRVTEEDLAGIAERVRQAVEALSTPYGNHPVRVTATIGAALLLPQDCPHLQPLRLIEDADRAMYDAKRSGRNRVRIVRCPSQ
ncbi:MAG: diguanylate cyclase [Planctomycetes bacterium]|nr:diguanylate cyclase [Planctomycetota bacterium]